MAFEKKQITNSNHRMIHPDDGAIDRSASDIESYTDTWDESHLAILPDQTPSYFVVKSRLSAEEAKAISDMSIGVGASGAVLNSGTLQYETVKRCLVDIINPDGCDGIIMKKDSQGRVSATTMRELADHGALTGVYAFFTHLQASGMESLKKN